MRFITKIVFVLLAAAPLYGAAWAASFSVSLDRETMTVGDQATLSLKFDGVQPQDAPTLPTIPGLQFQYVGPSSSFSVINGQVSSSITFNYIVTAQREGLFNIPGLRANVGGQLLSSQPARLTVTKVVPPPADAISAGNNLAFLKVSLPRNKIYAGEALVLHLDLYLRDEVQDFGNFQLLDPAMDGFSAGSVAEIPNQRRRVQVGNRVFTIIPYAVPLTAVKTGTATLGPFNARVVVVVPAANQGGDGFFPFFRQNEQKQVTLAAAPINVDLLPLPDQNKPADFSGAVGDYTMSATAGPTNLTVGDPITVRVQISGRGQLSAVALPAETAWHDFKTYSPTARLETSDQFGFEGTKTFEQIVSPENSDVHELPALAFSYFSPEDGRYHTLSQPAVPLVVHAAGSTPLPAVAAAKNAAENQAPQDVLPLKQNLGRLSRTGPPLIARPAFLAAQTVPVLAFFAAFIWRRRTDSLAHNPRLRRHRAVARLVAAGLADLKKAAAANQPDPFFATLFHLLQEQLGERLDCPASAITENVVDEHPLLRNASPALRDALREQFQLCNQARYAPVRGSSELNSVAAQFAKLMGDLQELKA